MRRVGKSVLLSQYREFLLESGVDEQNILLINKESIEFDFISNYQELYNFIKKTISPQPGVKHLLIDEIQEIDQWEKTINSFFAEGSYDITVTGSNARMLSTELSTLLAGRYVEISVYPFSFKEFRQVRAQTHPGEHASESFKLYLRYGGLPGIHSLPLTDEAVFPYLNAIFNSVLLKDVVLRNKIRDVEQLERITRFIFSNCGNITSAKNIADYLKSQRTKISIETVQNYLFYLSQAFMIHKLRRYDLKGKKVLEYSEKYYSADAGLRFGIVGYTDDDISGVLENIVFIELLNRGYNVYVGQIGQLKIDFIAEKQEEKRYIQVAYLLSNEKVVEREFGNLMRVNDNFPKMVLSMDEYWDKTRQGIVRKNIVDFLGEV